MSFINPYNQSGMVGGTGFDRPSWSIPGSYSPTSYNYDAGRASGFTDLAGVTSLGGLADTINNLYRGAQTQANAARVPNSPAMEEQSSKMIGEQLTGQLPSDVINMIKQGAAERAIGTGVGIGSGNANAAYLRALGLTSRDQQESGQRNLSAAYARNPAAPIMNLESQVITPLQAAQLDLERQRLNASTRGGGSGGGGGYSIPSSGGGVGYSPPTAQTLFGNGRTGYVYSQPQDWTGYMPSGYGGEGSSRAFEGYMPTSSGSMYMGDVSGYDPETAAYLNGGWQDEFFGDYGG